MAGSTTNRRSVFSSEIAREETLRSINNEGSSGTVRTESPPANGRSSVASSGSVRYEILQSPISSRGAVSCGTTSANDRNSAFCSGSVRYEVPQPPISSSGCDMPYLLAEVTVTRGRLCSNETVEYEVPQLRSQREDSSSSGRRDNLPIASTRHALRAVPSTASHQSQFLSKSSGLQLLGIHKMRPAKKTDTLFSNNICKTILLAALCGIILVGVTGTVLGTLAVKGVLCWECSSEEPDEMIRQEFSSLQKLVQDLQTSVVNSTLSATVNVTSAHIEECKMHSSSCTIFPFPRNYTYPNPVCTTPQLKISREGFYFVGVHCSIGLDDEDNNIELNSRFNGIITREVVSSRRAACQCYLPSLTYQVFQLPEEVKCLISVTLCPLILDITVP